MTEQASYIPLLRLLERPYVIVSADLPAALLELNLAPSLAAEVSLPQVLEGVLETGSDYWSGLALGWLESGFPMDASLCEAVLRYSQLKRNSQALRHRAFVVVRRWQRGALMCDAIHLPMFWGEDPRIDYRGTLALSDVLPPVGSMTFARFSDRYLRVGECLSVIWCPPYSDINGWDQQPSEILLSHLLNVRVVATGDQVSLPASPLSSPTDGRYRYELEVMSCVPFGALLAGLQGDQAPWELVKVGTDEGTKILPDGASWTAKARVGQLVYLCASLYESRVELILDVQGAEVFGLFQAYLFPGGDDFYIGRKRLQGAELEAVRSALQVATLLTDTSADYLDVST